MKIEDLFVVVVVYEIEFSKSSTYVSLENCLKHSNEKLEMLLYDNSIDDFNSGLVSNFINITYLHDSSNPGVSKAYNTGAKFAKKYEKKYLLFLDQDSVLEEGFLGCVVNTINSNPKDNIFSPFVYQKQKNILISPSEYKNFRGRYLKLANDRKYLLLENVSMINSGMVISLNLFSNVGGFNEAIKLDFSDHEFIHRVSKKVNRLVMIPTNLYHSLSILESGSLKNDLFRFRMYLNGGAIFSKSINKYAVFLYVSLGRCFFLTVNTRSIGFFKLLFNKILKSVN